MICTNRNCGVGSLLLRHDVFGLCQDFVELAVGGGLELAVVDLDAVVEIQGDAVQGGAGQLFASVATTFSLFDQLLRYPSVFDFTTL